VPRGHSMDVDLPHGLGGIVLAMLPDEPPPGNGEDCSTRCTLVGVMLCSASGSARQIGVLRDTLPG